MSGPGQQVARRPAVGVETIENLERIVRENDLEALHGKGGSFAQAFALAAGITQLREALPEAVLSNIMALQGSPLGFLTDKDRGRDGGRGPGYPVDVVREVIIEACLRGFYVVGNEFNIIGGRFYATKNGLARKVREFPGLANLLLNPAVPVLKNGGAVVHYRASWCLDGKPVPALERDIPVRVNEGMGADAILGKATRKMLAAIYQQLTGSDYAVPDGEIDDPPMLTVGSGSTAGATSSRSVTTPQATTPERSNDDMLQLEALAEKKGIPPLRLEQASQQMFKRSPRQLSDTEFATLLGWTQNGGVIPEVEP